jgi:hypothetical protein
VSFLELTSIAASLWSILGPGSIDALYNRLGRDPLAKLHPGQSPAAERNPGLSPFECEKPGVANGNYRYWVCKREGKSDDALLACYRAMLH